MQPVTLQVLTSMVCRLQCPELSMHNLFLGVSAECSSNMCCQYATELLQIIFTVLIDAISTVGKNGQQILSLILKQIKINAKLLTSFTTSGRVESSLINHVQVCSTLLAKFTEMKVGMLRPSMTRFMES